MSTDFTVKVVKISEVVPHPNADRLDLCTIAGWQCVTQRGSYKVGDLAIYIPIDSILPKEVEDTLFGPDSKVKLSKSRVKTIKLRGSISQGMLAKCSLFNVAEKEGHDCTKQLGVTKFEPPAPPPSMSGNPTAKKKKNPLFKEYGGLDNFKHYPDLFQSDEEVVITEKIHGTNFRFGWLPTVTDTFGKRIQKLLRILPKYEFVFGSNRVQLQNRVSSGGLKAKLLSWIPIKAVRTLAYQGYYQQSGVGNVYEEAVSIYDLKNRSAMFKGCIFYGEIYGDGIQKGYTYECKPGERKFIGFDVFGTKSGQYHDHTDTVELFSSIGLPTVPVLYAGPYSAAVAKVLTTGNSVIAPTQKVREGVVIRPISEQRGHNGRKILKLISDEYLLGDNTDFH